MSDCLTNVTAKTLRPVTASLRHDSHPYVLPVSPVFNRNFFRFSLPTMEIQDMLTCITVRKEEKKDEKRSQFFVYYRLGGSVRL
jgi:hypothetical protein